MWLLRAKSKRDILENISSDLVQYKKNSPTARQDPSLLHLEIYDCHWRAMLWAQSAAVLWAATCHSDRPVRVSCTTHPNYVVLDRACTQHGVSKWSYWKWGVSYWRKQRNISKYSVGVGFERNKPFRRLRRRQEDNIKMHTEETECECMGWIQLAQERVQWQAYLDTVMNLRVR
jgi:hypothetical protein